MCQRYESGEFGQESQLRKKNRSCWFLTTLKWFIVFMKLTVPILSCSKMLFDTAEEDANYNPLPEERPGGFAWGEGQRLGG